MRLAFESSGGGTAKGVAVPVARVGDSSKGPARAIDGPHPRRMAPERMRSSDNHCVVRRWGQLLSVKVRRDAEVGDSEISPDHVRGPHSEGCVEPKTS